MFAIAHAMERQAATRYADLATRARADGIPDIADLFERLADQERGHADNILKWSQQRCGKPPDPADIKWALPETFDEEAAGELAISRIASAYRVLSMAVRNEERAFTFWSYIAAEAAKPEIREAAERLAREELERVSMLRRARRQAYHAERAYHRPDSARSIGDRLAEAADLERRLAAQLEELAGQLTGDSQIRARELAAQSRTMADEAAGMSFDGNSGAMDDLDAAATAERLVEDYLDVGDLSRDETIALQTQSLAKRAISRLAWLRALTAKA
jgi:rubrerythrin